MAKREQIIPQTPVNYCVCDSPEVYIVINPSARLARLLLYYYIDSASGGLSRSCFVKVRGEVIGSLR